MGKLFALVIMGGLLVWSSFAGAKTKPNADKHRREVIGKSGQRWFVDSGGSDETSVIEQVFASDDSNDLVLSYRHFTSGPKQGQREVLFKAPSTLTAKAVADFI